MSYQRYIYKILQPFQGLLAGQIIMYETGCHTCIVKLADSITPTRYRHDLSEAFVDTGTYLKWKLDDGHICFATKQEVAKAASHMTWRIWMLVGSHFLNQTAQAMEAMYLLSRFGNRKHRLLPPAMCFSCMKQGNPFLTKQPPVTKKGKCPVCGFEDLLRITTFAWPLDLTVQGFGFTVGSTNMQGNDSHYTKGFKVEDWWAEYNYNTKKIAQ